MWVTVMINGSEARRRSAMECAGRNSYSSGARWLKHTLFCWDIFCLAPIRGDPSDQGAVCAWTRWHLLELSHDSRTIFRRKIAVGTDSRSGLVMDNSVHYGPTSFRSRTETAGSSLAYSEKKEGASGSSPEIQLRCQKLVYVMVT